MAGLLLLWVVVGVALIVRGDQKLFGWFGGKAGTNRRVLELLDRAGVHFAIIAGLSRAGGGSLARVGLPDPLAGAAVVGVMLNAAAALQGAAHG